MVGVNSGRQEPQGKDLSANTPLRFGSHSSDGRQLLQARNVRLCFLPPFKDKPGHLGYNARNTV